MNELEERYSPEGAAQIAKFEFGKAMEVDGYEDDGFTIQYEALRELLNLLDYQREPKTFITGVIFQSK